MLRHRVNQMVAVAVVYICAMLMDTLDSTVVTVALPTLGREFGVDAAAIESVIVGYLVSLAVFIPASGWLGDRFGHRQILLLALAIFVGASALCGAATSLDQLVLFLVLQGAGGGLLTPVGLALLFRTFPPEERVAVSRVLMFATILGPAHGPILGGIMIEHLSWRWIFYVNLPVGIGELLLGLLFLEDHPDHLDDPFGLPGFVLAGAGFAAVRYALSEGEPALGLAPDPGDCGDRDRPARRLRVGRAADGAADGSASGAEGPALPTDDDRLGLRDRRRPGHTLHGTALPAGGYRRLAAHIRADRLPGGDRRRDRHPGRGPDLPRIGPSRLMTGGLVWVSLVLAAVSFLDFDVNPWLIRALMFLLGCGMACVFVSNQAAALAIVSKADTGRASIRYSVQRQIGAAAGVAILSSILLAIGTERVTASGATVPNQDAYRVAFLVAAALALIGALLATRVLDEDAAVTTRRAR